MRIPTRQRAKELRQLIPIAGRHAALQVVRAEGDWLLARGALSENLWLVHAQARLHRLSSRRRDEFRTKITQSSAALAGQPGVGKTVGCSALLLAVHFLLGLGSCAARVPVTVSADSPTEATDPEPPGPELAGRLQNCSPGTADCDRNPQNDCEAVLADDSQNCGVCGRICPHNHVCMGGACRLFGCQGAGCDE